MLPTMMIVKVQCKNKLDLSTSTVLNTIKKEMKEEHGGPNAWTLYYYEDSIPAKDRTILTYKRPYLRNDRTCDIITVQPKVHYSIKTLFLIYIY